MAPAKTRMSKSKNRVEKILRDFLTLPALPRLPLAPLLPLKPLEPF